MKTITKEETLIDKIKDKATTVLAYFCALLVVLAVMLFLMSAESLVTLMLDVLGKGWNFVLAMF